MTTTQLAKPTVGQNRPWNTYFGGLWNYRTLIYLFARREIRIRYAQTLLGLAWAVLQPLLGVLIFTLFFDKVVHIQTQQVPYPLFVTAGIGVWLFFTAVVNNAGTALVQAQNIIRKVYFPRLVLPLAKTLSSLVDFAVSIVLLFVLKVVYADSWSWHLLLLPIAILVCALVGLTIAISLSALTVRFRDLLLILPYALNMSVWFTPVFYPVTLLPEGFRFLLYLNPMAGMLEGFRWAALGHYAFDVQFLWGFVPLMVLFVVSMLLFRDIDRDLTDYL